MTPPCRVCSGVAVPFFAGARNFYRCVACSLVFTDETGSRDEQEKHYKAQWGNAQPEFWKQQAETLLSVAQKYGVPKRALDFGAGSGELTRELVRRGIDCTPLEPMTHGYLKDQRYAEKFDLIVAVEVVEHLVDLWEELREMEKALAPGGVVLFTTLLTEGFIHLPDAAAHFKNWWYKDDLTHVSFFCHSSLDALGRVGGWEVDVIAGQVIALRRPGGR